MCPYRREYQLRKKHYCHLCGKPFSRRWNKERHITSVHQSNPLSPSFGIQDGNYEVSKFKSHTSNYYSRYSNFHSPQLQRKNPLDPSLEILRKISEFKRLKEDLLSTPTRQPWYRLKGDIPDTINTNSFAPQFTFQDLGIIGYMGYVCQNCLIAHSLPIYQVKNKPGVKPILTRHSCNTKRLSEIQQQTLNKRDILANLYFNQLPRQILESAKEWTKNNCTLMAIEVAAPFEGCPTIDLLDQKEWAILAIKNGFAVLTNEQLEDFIHTVKTATCACFRIVENKGSEESRRIFLMSLTGGFQPLVTNTAQLRK